MFDRKSEEEEMKEGSKDAHGMASGGGIIRLLLP